MALVSVHHLIAPANRMHLLHRMQQHTFASLAKQAMRRRRDDARRRIVSSR
jgi:hypothetical protein